jgi:hypothetical protein
MARKVVQVALYLTVWLAFSVPIWAALAFFLLFA